MKKLSYFILLILVIAILAGCKSSDYSDAMKAFKAGDYAASGDMFRGLEDYKNSEEYAQESDYLLAGEYMESGEFKAARDLYIALGDYKDSAELAKQANAAMLLQVAEGTWTAPVDLTDLFRVYLSEHLNTEVLDMIEMPDMTVSCVLVCSEDTTFDVKVDEQSSIEMVRNLKDQVVNAMIAWLGQEFRNLAEKAGINLDNAVASYIADGIEKLAIARLGMTVRDYIDKALPDDSALAVTNLFKYSGVYKIDDSGLIFKVADNLNPAVYDEASGVLQLTLNGRVLEFVK